MRKFKIAIFDLDGTIADTEQLILACYKHSLAVHGCIQQSDETLQGLTGIALETVYRKIAPDIDSGKMCDTHRCFQEKNMNLVQAFPGAQTVLSELSSRGVRIAVATNRSRQSALRVLDIVGLKEYVEFLVAVDDVQDPKPNPEALYRIMKQFGATPDMTCMIGDTETDIYAGKSACVTTVGVTYGHRGKLIEKYNSDYIVDSLEEIMPLFATAS